MKRALLVALFLLGSTPLFAQTTTATGKFEWDQQAVDAAEAATFTYRYYADGATVGGVLANVTCAGTAPIVCVAPIPAFTPGAHSVVFTASNVAGESVKSVVLQFRLVVVPNPPLNPRTINTI